MVPLNSLATRLRSSEKPIESRRREAPITATERGEKMASRGRVAVGLVIGANLSGPARRKEHFQSFRRQAHRQGEPFGAQVAVHLRRGAGRTGEDDFLGA